MLLAASAAPIPYKLFTISAGALSMALLPFVIASLVGRGSRFFLVAALIRWGGMRFEPLLRRYIDWIGWAGVLILAPVALYFIIR